MGEHGINIASMDVGRLKVGEKAVMVLSVDSVVSEEVLHKITKLEGISEATLVKL